ncbi:protein cortex [Monomorium pharaonis]|uniref:protein cortex n=1 Tax=Monomorium pharaonis TaxID=307658 RepID=UPI001746CC07|nr:protein cortex [Monomorium pharaonis]
MCIKGSFFFIKVIPRKWLLASTPLDKCEAGDNPEPEQCNAQKFQHPNCIKIETCPLISKHTYPGDRFLSSRRGFSVDMAHYLLTKDDTTKKDDIHILDVCKEVESLDTTYRRKALRAIMIEWSLMPELDRGKILRFSGSMTRPQNPPYPEYEKKGNWKCLPRKKTLIGSADRMLCMPDTVSVLNDKAVDWNCHELIAVSDCNLLTIYYNNGEKITTITTTGTDPDNPNTKITDLKWSNDGDKLTISLFVPVVRLSSLMLYDLRKAKISWTVYCKCWIPIENKGCVMRCICWSANDHQIVTGCSGKISVYEADTGKLLNRKRVHESDILTLSFSPNFKYLVSSARDKIVRLFTWPEFTPCFNIKFYKPVKAVAWHPQVSGLLCIGGRKNGSLSLWNVNKCAMTAFVRTKFDGRVENLAWNKLSGELVVHWTYKEEDNRYTIVAVLASFNRIVDVLSLDKETKLSFLKFNATHKQLMLCSGETPALRVTHARIRVM